MISAVKFFHISALSVWCTGLLLLPVLLQCADNPVREGEAARMRMFAHHACNAIVSPAAVIATVAGGVLLFARWVVDPWMFVKLALIAVLVLMHTYVLSFRNATGREGLCQAGSFAHGAFSWRIRHHVRHTFCRSRQAAADCRCDAGFAAQSGGRSAFVSDRAKLIIEYELAVMPSCQPRKSNAQRGKQNSERQDSLLVSCESEAVVCAEHRVQRDCENKMSPAWRMRSDAWHEQQFNSACDAREQTNVESGANRPQCRARPERFARPPVENIGAECADRKRNWKSDQHGVNGMAGHGNARFGVVKNVFGVKWIKSALGVCVRCFHRPALLGMFVLVSGCGGPLSTLDPAGSAARDTLTLLSVLLVLAEGSFLVIFGLFLLAFRRNKGRSVSLQLFLVWGGLVFPLILLTFAIVYGVVLGERITGAHERTAFRVEAQAEQWRWQFTRHTPAGSRTVAACRGFAFAW